MSFTIRAAHLYDLTAEDVKGFNAVVDEIEKSDHIQQRISVVRK